MTVIPNPALVKSMIQAGIRRLQSDRAVTTQLEADVIEVDDHVEIAVDAPGVEEADIQVRYLADEVLIRMDRFRNARETLELVVAGRSVGFDGRVPIPEHVDVDPETATATLRAHGTLIIRLPKLADPSEDDLVATVDN